MKYIISLALHLYSISKKTCANYKNSGIGYNKYARNLSKRTNARFLQASTSEIYGDPLIHPQKEEYWGNVNQLE